MPLGSAKVGLFGAAGAATAGSTGVFSGGRTGASTNTNVMQYINISTTGDATDFGDKTVSFNECGNTSNGTNDRGVSGGGYDNVAPSTVVIDYITISTTGDATDFGDLTQTRGGVAAVSNGPNERGVWMGGYIASGTSYDILDYVTINSTGNATDFGDHTNQRWQHAAMSNGTDERGVTAGGLAGTYGGSDTNIIEYITINSTGNATDFGDLLVANAYVSGLSNDTNDRGVISGGHTTARVNVIQYITITSTGTSTDFGDLAHKFTAHTGLSNGTAERGVWGGGNAAEVKYNVINYITINSTGDTTDFGDLLVAKQSMGGTGISDAAA